MRIDPIRPVRIPLLTLLLVLALPQFLLAQTSNADSGIPLERLLNNDGTLHPSFGLTGTVDPQGWRMTLSPDGSPRFFRASGPLRVAATKADTADVHWDSRFTSPSGVDGQVYALAVIGTDLYVGGGFSSTDQGLASNIARWSITSHTWSTLGSGVDGIVLSLAVLGTDLYVGGRFTQAGGVTAHCIAKWSGSSWSALGTAPNDGTNNTVGTIVASGTNIFVGGSFTFAGGTSASRVARWDGTGWSALGSGVNGTVHALAVMGSDLFAGGAFLTAGGNPAHSIARWTGSAWLTLGTSPNDGVNDVVYTLKAASPYLYVGGSFDSTGTGVPANSIARWNGTTWTALGNGLTGGPVRALAVSGSSLYAVGAFAASGILAAHGAAVWDTASSTWSALHQGLDEDVFALVLASSDLYVGGAFTAYMNTSTPSPANHIAKWSGSAWQSLSGQVGNSVSGPDVYALAINGTDLYIGGIFSNAGSLAANNIVKYDVSANTWTSLGSGSNNGVNGEVDAIAMGSTGDVYAGGTFTSAGGSPAHGIAKWNGSSWSALGTSPNDGVNSYVSALAVNGTNVFVGGNFTTAGGMSANYIARWDGSSWSALGSGTNLPVYAVAAIGSDLYAGGSFTSAGGTVVNNIARWTGSSWVPVGTPPDDGVDNSVSSFARLGSTLYVGGSFIHAAGSTITANGIAAWNGTTWSALGNGFTFGNEVGSVYALGVSQGSVYATGSFTSSGITAMSNIARWDTAAGGSWNALGSGLGGPADALANSGGDIYVAGEFSTAGSKVSFRLGHWNPELIAVGVNEPAPVARGFALEQNYPNPFNPTTAISYQLAAGSWVSLKVYNILGQQVATLVNEFGNAGLHTVTFNASGLASGVYFYRLVAGQNVDQKKMLLLK